MPLSKNRVATEKSGAASPSPSLPGMMSAEAAITVADEYVCAMTPVGSGPAGLEKVLLEGEALAGPGIEEGGEEGAEQAYKAQIELSSLAKRLIDSELSRHRADTAMGGNGVDRH